jgi:hypothetical protein
MMVPLLVFLAAAYVASRLIYWLVIDREVPGGWDRRFGVPEELQAGVGLWTVDDLTPDGKAATQQGLKREVRVFHDVQTGSLTRQARRRDLATNAIVSVEKDVPIPRRRRRI